MYVLGGSIFSGFPRTFSFAWFSELSLFLLIAHMLFAFQTTPMQSSYLYKGAQQFTVPSQNTEF